MVTFIGGSKGRTDMVVSIEKHKITSRNKQRQAPERLPSEYGQFHTRSDQHADQDGAGILTRLWRRLRR